MLLQRHQGAIPQHGDAPPAFTTINTQYDQFTPRGPCTLAIFPFIAYPIKQKELPTFQNPFTISDI